MQFKLFNFHKLIGNFATSLVGTFIPLIIYKTTNSLRLAVLYIFGQCLCRLLSNYIFKKLFNKNPQLTLFIRVIPLLIYNISLIFLEDFLVLGLILVPISYGINISFKNNASGILLNYSSRKRSGKNIIISRIVDAVSAIVACIAGGLFIDWNQTALIIFSISLYIISVLPLFIYYLINRTKDGFNRDFISNAAITYDNEPELKQKRRNLVKEFIVRYFFFYAIFCVIDVFTNMYTIHMFVTSPTFAMAGYLTAMFQFANLVGLLVVGVIGKKFDYKNVNYVFAILCAIPLGVIPFLQNYLCIYALIFVFGFSYSICSYFMMNSLMSKCKIINATNKALFARQNGIITGQMVTPVIVMIFNCITPVFFVMVGALIIYAIYTNIAEDKLRKKLVDYLENNEIE